MALSTKDAGVVQPDVTPKSLKWLPSTYKKRIIKVDKTLPTSDEVVGRRSGVSGIMPEIDHLTMLPTTSTSVQKGKSEVGRKVNTMDERNKVASPTSNPSGAPPHLQRTAHPVNPILGRKKIKFQEGGKLISKKDYSIDDITKSDAYNSLPATIIKVIDPTGISSYGDVYNAWTDGKFDYQDVLEPMGAIPVLGKLGKVGKYLGKSIKGLNELDDAKKIVKAGLKSIGSEPALLRGRKSIPAYTKYFNPLMRGEERAAGIAKMTEFKNAGKIVRQNNILNNTQYGIRAAGDIDDLLDIKTGVAATIPIK